MHGSCAVDPVFREATRADARQVVDLYRHAYDGTYPVAEVQTVPGAERALEDPSKRWVVATVEGRVVAAGAAKAHAWNRSTEIGGLVTHSSYQRQGLCRGIMERLCSGPRTDILFADARTGASLRAMAPFLPETWGYLPGFRLTRSRELHIVVGACPGARIAHSGAPPAVVGPPAAKTESLGQTTITYDASEQERYLLVRGVVGKIGALENLSEYRTAQYVEMDVINNDALMHSALSSLGFAPCCLLPGWVPWGERRIDAWRYARWTVQPTALDTVTLTGRSIQEDRLRREVDQWMKKYG